MAASPAASLKRMLKRNPGDQSALMLMASIACRYALPNYQFQRTTSSSTHAA